MSQSNRYYRKRQRMLKRKAKKLRKLSLFGVAKPKKKRFNRNRHHIKNVCNLGRTCPQNILILDVERHNWIHRIFKNLDFYDIIVLLIRTCRAKHYEDINPRVAKFYELV